MLRVHPLSPVKLMVCLSCPSGAWEAVMNPGVGGITTIRDDQKLLSDERYITLSPKEWFIPQDIKGT